MFISKRLARRIGFRTTASHIRIYGYAISRFALSIILAAVGAGLFFYGYLAMGNRPYDFIVCALGILVGYGAYRIDKRWFQEMFSENLNNSTKII